MLKQITIKDNEEIVEFEIKKTGKVEIAGSMGHTLNVMQLHYNKCKEFKQIKEEYEKPRVS